MYSPTITPYTPANLQNTMAVLAAEKAKGTLQQYVQQHLAQNPNDTNMVALATQVNKMSAPPAQMPSTTVANQDIASMAPPRPMPVQGMAPAGAGPNMPNGMPMQGPGSPAQIAPQVAQGLPEDVGIGALPAQNLTKMAGGGITGDVHRYNGAFDPQLVSTNPHAPGGAQYYYDFPYNPRMPMDPKYKPLMGQVFKSPEEAQTAFSRIGSADYTAAAGAPGIAQLLGQEQPTPAQLNASQTGNDNVGAGNADTSANPPAAPTPWSPNIQAPTITAGGPALGPAPTAAGVKRDVRQFYDPSGINQLAQENMTEAGVQNAQNAAALERMLANRPKLGEKAEQRLLAEQGKEEGDKENAKSMGFIEAGLAILGGTSPYAFQNLSLAKEGIKSYKDDMREIKKAHDLRQQAFDHLDEMRDAQTIGDQNLRFTEGEKAGDKMLAARNTFANTLEKTAGVDATIGASMFDNATKQWHTDRNASAELNLKASLGNAQLKMEADKLNMPPESARVAMMLGNGDLATGLEKMTLLQAGKLNPMKEYLDYKTKLTGKLDPYGQQVPIQTADEYFRDLDNAMKSYKTMQGPTVSTQAPPVLRGQ